MALMTQFRLNPVDSSQSHTVTASKQIFNFYQEAGGDDDHGIITGDMSPDPPIICPGPNVRGVPAHGRGTRGIAAGPCHASVPTESALLQARVGPSGPLGCRDPGQVPG